MLLNFMVNCVNCGNCAKFDEIGNSLLKINVNLWLFDSMNFHFFLLSVFKLTFANKEQTMEIFVEWIHFYIENKLAYYSFILSKHFQWNKFLFVSFNFFNAIMKRFASNGESASTFKHFENCNKKNFYSVFFEHLNNLNWMKT